MDGRIFPVFAVIHPYDRVSGIFLYLFQIRMVHLRLKE